MRRPSPAFILIISFLSFLMACPDPRGSYRESRKAYRGWRLQDSISTHQAGGLRRETPSPSLSSVTCMTKGKGVPKDYDEAVKWYSRAAKQGNKEARHNLGLMGDQDQVAKDRAEKEKWHRRDGRPQNAGCPAEPPSYGGPRREGEVAPRDGRTAERRCPAEPPSYGGPRREGEVAPRGGRTAKHPCPAEPPSYGGPASGKERWHRGAAEPQNAAAPPNLVSYG